MRIIPFDTPNSVPYLNIASLVYSEQVGIKTQEEWDLVGIF